MAARLCSSLLQSSLAIVFVSLLVLGVMEGMSPFASLLMQWSKAGTAIGTNDWKQTGPVVEAAKNVLLGKAESLRPTAVANCTATVHQLLSPGKILVVVQDPDVTMALLGANCEEKDPDFVVQDPDVAPTLLKD